MWNGLGGWRRVDLRKFQSKEDIPDRQAAITRLYWRPALRNHFQTRLNFHIRPNHQTRPNFQAILNFWQDQITKQDQSPTKPTKFSLNPSSKTIFEAKVHFHPGLFADGKSQFRLAEGKYHFQIKKKISPKSSISPPNKKMSYFPSRSPALVQSLLSQALAIYQTAKKGRRKPNLVSWATI